MGRELRIIDPDTIYHEISNGNNWGTIAFDRVDFESLERELDRAATKFQWEVFGWAFLSTHYHVLLRTPKGGFSQGFQEMNGNHARRTNARHDRRDHLFRHRPFCRPVLSDAHFITVTAYIALNPVLAGLCAQPLAWPYGSYRALLGKAPAPPWLRVEKVLGFFGNAPEAARLELARLVSGRQLLVSNTGEELWPATSG
jgi:putative transposase